MNCDAHIIAYYLGYEVCKSGESYSKIFLIRHYKMTIQNWRMRTKTMCWSNQSSALVIMWQEVWSRSGCKSRKDSGSLCHRVRTECFDALWTEVNDYLWIYMCAQVLLLKEQTRRSCWLIWRRSWSRAEIWFEHSNSYCRSDTRAAVMWCCVYDSSWKSFLSGQCNSAPPRCADGLLLSGGVGAATGPLGGV